MTQFQRHYRPRRFWSLGWHRQRVLFRWRLKQLCANDLLLLLMGVLVLCGLGAWYVSQPGTFFHPSLAPPLLSEKELLDLYPPLAPPSECERNVLLEKLPPASNTSQHGSADEAIPTRRGNLGSAPLTRADLDLLTRYPLFAAADLLLGDRRRRLSLFFGDDRVMCTLALLYLRNCDEDKETVLGCIRRVGPVNMAKLMPVKCASTNVFDTLLRLSTQLNAACGAPSNGPVRMDDVLLGEVEETAMLRFSTPQRARLRSMLLDGERGADLARRVREGNGTLTDEEQDAVREAFHVPLADRPPFRMPPSQRCTARYGREPKEFVNHPIGYGLRTRPATITYPKRKLFEFFPINPSSSPTSLSIYDDERDGYVLTGDKRLVHEWLYATMLRYSMFAFTHKRGGFDCLRHAEIMHYGAVPVFVDLRRAPRLTSSSVPREELLKVLEHPLLSHIGYVDSKGRMFPDKDRALAKVGWPLYISSHFMVMMRNTRSADFRRPGFVNLEPFREEHALDVAAGRATGPLSFRSPVIQRHYHELAKPLWNLYGSHYSAASKVAYMLDTMGHPEPRRVLVIANKLFPSDYLHETIVMGLGELGIFTEVLMNQEGNKNQALSLVDAKGDGATFLTEGDSETGQYHETEAAQSFPLLPFMGDPREIGIRRIEERVLREVSGFLMTYSTARRYNPFVVSRILGAQSVHSLDTQKELLWEPAMAVAEKRLRQGRYDLVLYTDVTEYLDQMYSPDFPLLATVQAVLPRDRIALIDHMDYRRCGQLHNPLTLAGHGHIFTREHPSRCPPLYDDTTPANGSRPKSVFSLENDVH